MMEKTKKLITSLQSRLEALKSDPESSYLDVLTLEERLYDARIWLKILGRCQRGQSKASREPWLAIPKPLSQEEVAEHVHRAHQRALRRLKNLAQ